MLIFFTNQGQLSWRWWNLFAFDFVVTAAAMITLFYNLLKIWHKYEYKYLDTISSLRKFPKMPFTVRWRRRWRKWIWRMKKLRIIRWKFLEKMWKILVPYFLKKRKNCSVCSAEVAVALQDYIPLSYDVVVNSKLTNDSNNYWTDKLGVHMLFNCNIFTVI